MSRVVYGVQPVAELLRHPGRALKLLVGKEQRGALARLVEDARAQGVPVEEVPPRLLDDLTEHGVHQGILAKAKALEFTRLPVLARRAVEEPGRQLLLACDEITDPQNFGAILRSAEVLGCKGALFMARRNAQVTPLVEKASSGAVEHLPLVQVVNLGQALAELKEQGFEVVGLDAGGAVTLYDLAPVPRRVLVVGSEGKGLRPSIRALCDAIAGIPTPGRVTSLNASVAVGIAIAWLQRPG